MEHIYIRNVARLCIWRWFISMCGTGMYMILMCIIMYHNNIKERMVASVYLLNIIMYIYELFLDVFGVARHPRYGKSDCHATYRGEMEAFPASFGARMLLRCAPYI